MYSTPGSRSATWTGPAQGPREHPAGDLASRLQRRPGTAGVNRTAPHTQPPAAGSRDPAGVNRRDDAHRWWASPQRGGPWASAALPGSSPLRSSLLALITTSCGRQVVTGRYTSVAEREHTEHTHKRIANIKKYRVMEGEVWERIGSLGGKSRGSVSVGGLGGSHGL